MKLVKKDIVAKNGTGYVVLIPEHSEDLWHLYHIIQPGDQIRASSIRKVQRESNTGSVSSDRMRINITISVDRVDFDTAQSGMLRLAGKNIVENKFVKLGAYHTVEVEPNRKLSIAKQCWDSVVLDRLRDACDVAKSADVAAVTLNEGQARVCLLTSHMTVERQKIDMNIPKKRSAAGAGSGGGSSYEKSLERFFEAVLQALLRHVDFSVVKCLILASPGFVKDQLFAYIFKQAHARENELKDLVANKDKILLVHASSGSRQALSEVLKDPAVAKRLEDTKAAGEVRALAEFYQLFSSNSARVFYGPKHVLRTNEQMAIQTLLITDELFRSSDPVTRSKWVRLVEQVRGYGGAVHIFSSMHVSGQQLSNLGGIAAITRFAMQDIEDEDDGAAHDDAEGHAVRGEDDDLISDSSSDSGSDLGSDEEDTTPKTPLSAKSHASALSAAFDAQQSAQQKRVDRDVSDFLNQ